MSRQASPFGSRTILAVLAVGTAAFLLFLYALGAGWSGNGDKNAGAHGASNGLNGFAGLVQLLEARGHNVALSRSEARMDDETLLILTPQHDADGEAISEIIQTRRYVGPTLVILPKWLAMPADQVSSLDAPRGWVLVFDALAPDWLGTVIGFEGAEVEIGQRSGWRGMGLSAGYPNPEQVQTMTAPRLGPLLADAEGGIAAGFLVDEGHYPFLSGASARPNGDVEDSDHDLWPVVIIAEPDLANNYGLADIQRAHAAVRIVEASMNGQDFPIVFDLTQAGLARSTNLLTLAFEPPFLAATLCLLLAAIFIAWRAFRRFGPPVAEEPATSMGKRQLARNAGDLVARAKRLHLLGPPYASLVSARLARSLGIRDTDPEGRDAAIARVLAARNLSGEYINQADVLRRASHAAELLRAANALRTIERTVIS